MRRLPFYRSLSATKQRRALPGRRFFHADFIRQHPSPRLTYVGADLDSQLRYSVERDALPLYLRVEDRNSMAHSLEVRLPFMDYRLVSLAFRLPPNLKVRGRWNKYVLRESMRGRIPESVRTRVDKMGFPTPARTWLSGVLYESARDILTSRETRERGIFNVDAILRAMDSFRNGRTDISGLLFDLVQTELWARLATADQAPSP